MFPPGWDADPQSQQYYRECRDVEAEWREKYDKDCQELHDWYKEPQGDIARESVGYRLNKNLPPHGKPIDCGGSYTLSPETRLYLAEQYCELCRRRKTFRNTDCYRIWLKSDRARKNHDIAQNSACRRCRECRGGGTEPGPYEQLPPKLPNPPPAQFPEPPWPYI